MASSRIPGFYKLPLDERQRIAAERLDLTAVELQSLDRGGLERDTADKMIENVVGSFTLPFALGLNVADERHATTWCRWSSRSRRWWPPRPTPRA